MGIYVYTLRTKSITANNCKIHAFKYLCRANDLEDPWTGFSKRTHLLQINIQRVEDRWTPENMPKYIIIEDFTIGTPIYEIKENFSPVWYDSDELKAEIVGYLTKHGRKWTIQSILKTMEIEHNAFKQALNLELIKINNNMVTTGEDYNNFMKDLIGYTYLNYKDEFVQEYRSLRNKTELINS